MYKLQIYNNYIYIYNNNINVYSYISMQVIWEELYSAKSSRDKCTLYQLQNLIDRRDVSSDPKGNLHACQSFLTVVIEAEILVAFVATHKL